MDAIEAIAFAGGAGFAVVVVAAVVVIIGVSHEEHLGTLTSQHPPSIPALLARLVLRTYVRLPTERRHKDACPNAHECNDDRGTGNAATEKSKQPSKLDENVNDEFR
jgi:hypothetical protein